MKKDSIKGCVFKPNEVEIIAYGERGVAHVSADGFSFLDTNIKVEDILLVNRYVSSKLYPVDVQYSIVYKCSDEEVALFEFHRNPDFKRVSFDEDVEAWVKSNAITLGEDDWTSFTPVKNGYLTYTYRETHAEYYEKTSAQNKLFSVGLFVAGVIFAVVGGIMIGIGRLSFGAGAIVLGVLAALIGGYCVIKKN